MDRTKTGTENAKQLAQDLGDFVNRYGYEADVRVFVDTLASQHRTLQQSATGLMFAWLAYLSSLSENYYDLRNEHAVKTAKKIRAVLEDEYGPAWMRMPLI